MIPFELIAALISMGGTLASVLVALIALHFSRSFGGWRREQRQATTVGVLAEYRERIIEPTFAIAALSPAEFVASASSSPIEELKQSLVSYLNSMEYISLLINSHAVEEDMCRRFIRVSVVRSFERLLSYILAAREASKNPDLFAEYEALARRWGSNI
jgi:hypothetical protein